MRRLLNVSSKKDVEATLQAMDNARQGYEDGLLTFSEYLMISREIVLTRIMEEKDILKEHLRDLGEDV